MHRVLRYIRGFVKIGMALITVSVDLYRCERHGPQLFRFLHREVDVACIRERDSQYAI